MGIWFPEYSLTVVDMGGGPGCEDVQPSVVSARADMPGNACCSVGSAPVCSGMPCAERATSCRGSLFQERSPVQLAAGGPDSDS